MPLRPHKRIRIPSRRIWSRRKPPMLEKLVAAGRLPHLSERLPKSPAIVEPANELGRYGGVWRRIALGSGMAGMARIIYDPALRWSADGMEIQPNMCWKYEVSDDHRKFTFFLREGVRWSDGHPLTTEDVQFWWEDYILNKDIYPLTPTWIQINGKLPTLEIPGPYKFRLMFPHPYALFLERVAWQGNMWMPKHYLKQFHEKYRPKRELEAQAGAAGFRMWFQLFEDKASWGTNFEVPLTTAWVPKNKWSSYHKIFERNPYFWKVDTEGRQLPYIDRVTHDTLLDQGTALLTLTGGDVLMQNRYVDFKDLPLLQEAAKTGKLEIYTWTHAGNRALSIMVNQSYAGEDNFIGALLREKKFRWALSYALPRKEISEMFYFGLGEPSQLAPIKESPYYEYGKKFAETALAYGPEKANHLLDELGLTERNAEGYRLRPDGKPLALLLNYGHTRESVQIIEYFSIACLKPLGIKGVLKPNTGYGSRMRMLNIGGGLDRGMQVLIEPFWYIPYSRYSYWASQYGLWYESHRRRGWKPTGDIARILEIYDQIKICPDKHKRYELMGRIFDLHAENLWLIGTLANLPEPLIVSPRAGNVPRHVVSDWLFMTPGNAHPEQFYNKW